MVLAIGLVVDDAIVVVENVHRHLEMGKDGKTAAIDAARELGLPIIAMTTTLVAVYAPIGFMGGLVGSLFVEFAFTLAGAVLISGIVALTLSPMISARVLRSSKQQSRFEHAVEGFFNWLARVYGRALHGWLDYPSATLLVAIAIIGSIYIMYDMTKKELAPTEDQSILFFMATAPQTATIDYDIHYVKQVQQVFEQIPEYKESFILAGFGGDTSSTFGGFKMAQPSERERSQSDIQPQLQGALEQVPGFQTVIFPRPSLPTPGNGIPVEFVIVSDMEIEELNGLADQLLGQAMGSGKFIFLSKDIEYTRPRTTIDIDRDLAGDLGISMQDLGRSLAVMLNEDRVNWFSLGGRSYQVIPQVNQDARNTITEVEDYQIRTGSGELVPLSTLVTVSEDVVPSKRTQFQQLNSITLSGVATPGVALGDALAYLEQTGSRYLPTQRALGLQGRVAPVQERGRRAGGDLLPVHPDHLSGARGAVRELARPVRDPDVGAAVHLRRHGVFVPWLRQYQHLHPGGPDHADRPDREERHPHRRVRQPTARTPGPGQTRRGRAGIADPAAPDPDDHGGHAGGHGAAADRERPRRGQPLRHRLVITTGLGIGTLFTLFVVPAMYVMVASRALKGGAEAERQASVIAG
jgi:multidrug efflux pump